MKKPNFAKVSPFMVDPEPIEEAFLLSPEDLEKATETEKESVVEKHKSISYWRDAWRRFRKNTVSMVALFVFILILLFAFLGPKLIPYDYKEQYRMSLNLGPLQYSEEEQLCFDIAKENDGYYAAFMADGGMIQKKIKYYFIENGKVYTFSVKKTYNEETHAMLLFNADAENPLVLKEIDKATGEWKADEPIETSNEIPELTEQEQKLRWEIKQIELMHGVFPHVFGTDDSGRDLMARTMYGAQVSIIVGITAALIVLVIGSIYGSISGLAGGVTDFIMMRIVELIYSIPEVLIVLLLQMVLNPQNQDNPSFLQKWLDANRNGAFRVLSDLGVGVVSIFITFALLYWVTMARIVRGQVLQLKKQEYVNAAVALGAGKWRIIRRHLLPNAVGTLVITTCLQIPSAIFLESFLSFLGLGVSAPMPSLGSLCSDALKSIWLYPYQLVFPAILLTLIVLSLNLVGDGLRDALDPRLKK